MFKAIMIGAGARGIGVYGDYALHHQDEITFVGVAEPDPVRRGYFALQHRLSLENQFSDYLPILEKERFADVCFICTQDSMHLEPAIMAMEKGYHVFLEKPMAVKPEDCIALEEAATKNGVILMIGHVLRYTEFFSQIKEWLEAKEIGELTAIQHNENVGFWHYAHSYVRGNWRNEALSSPMILAKSCHDLDLLIWFAASHPTKIASFGNLKHFCKKNAPEGSPDYCMNGCPAQDECVFFAPKVYLNAPIWMKLPVSNDMSDESLLKVLPTSPYGRCVYRCDNDVVDHQSTTIEFENGVTACFTMSAFTNENMRTIKLMGTKGEIRGHMEKNELILAKFGQEPITVRFNGDDIAGHGGGDHGIMHDFVKMVSEGKKLEKADVKASVESHLLAFAAEISRRYDKVVDFSKYCSSFSDLSLRSAKAEDVEKAIVLASETFDKSMGSLFPLLLSQANRNHMFVAAYKNEVCSMVNYYPSVVRLIDCDIMAASIGSVATSPLYRRRDLASKLLSIAKTQMEREEIDLVIISGEGGIYDRFGAKRAGNVNGYLIDIDNLPLNDVVTIKDYDEKYLFDLKTIYDREPIRYLRNDQEFAMLIKGSTYPEPFAETHLEIIFKKGKPVAYVNLKKSDDPDELLIREIAGPREDILSSLRQIMAKYGHRQIILPVDISDPINSLMDKDAAMKTDQYASFTVLNWERFFKKLQPYFQTKGCIVTIAEKDGKQTLEVNGSRFETDNCRDLISIVFGEANSERTGIPVSFSEVFPIPFVWTNNMNYQ